MLQKNEMLQPHMLQPHTAPQRPQVQRLIPFMVAIVFSVLEKSLSIKTTHTARKSRLTDCIYREFS